MASVSTLKGFLQRLLRPDSISRMALSIYVLQAIGVAIGLVNNIVMARVLQPADKGVFDIFTLIMQLTVDLGMLGIGSGLLYFLANRGQPLAKVHGTGIAFSLILGGLAAGIGWALLPIWSRVFVGIDSWMITLGFLMTAAGIYHLISSALLVGTNRAIVNYQLRLMSAILFFIPTVGGLLFFRLGVREYVYVRVVVSLVSAIAAFLFLFRQERHLQADFTLFRQSLRYGLVIYAGYIANLLHYRVDQIMLNTLIGSTAVGIYSVGVRWAEMLFMLDSAISESALYRISSLPPAESRKLTVRLFKVQLFVSGSGAIGLAVITYPMIITLYGAPFKDAVIPLLILLPGVTAWSVSKLLSMYISYNRGMFLLPVSVSAIGLLINLIMNYLLIKPYGINGAALASTISYSVSFLCTILIFWLYPLASSSEVDGA